MGPNGEPVFSGDFFLQLFYLTILEFYDFITYRADEMVVVPFMGHVVELCLAAEVLLLSEAGITQEFERAVDRGQADMGVPSWRGAGTSVRPSRVPFSKRW